MMNQNSNSQTFWKYDIQFWLQKKLEGDLTFQQVTTHLKKKSSLHKDALLFWNQFRNPLMLLLIGAVILSAFLGDTSDVFIILFIVLSTGILSFIQERNAGKVVEKLQSMIALKCSVIRDGIEKEMNASEIVPGDTLTFKAGDMIPADCLIMESNELHVNEASLTGESYPVRKFSGILPETTELSQRTNCLWEGSNIVSGTGKALVIHTGDNTIFGSITESANTSVETTFEKGIKDFGFFLMKITLTLSIFILMVNLMFHKGVIESALFALALAVGMAPELLPAITTIAMSAGAKRMLEKKVIVKKLASIQNLGEVNLLCTDKTGTITEGAIHVAKIIDTKGNENEFVKKLAFWNASLETGYANPIDQALRQIKLLENETVKKEGEIPYDFIRKKLSVAVQNNDQTLLISKGAFTQILESCDQVLVENEKTEPMNLHVERLKKDFESHGTQGFRTIGVCYKPMLIKAGDRNIDKSDEEKMIFAGFILLQDPIKPNIEHTIKELKQLSVDLKIITGDNQNVASSIGRSLGISEPNILTGRELLEMSTDALELRVKSTFIFADIEPQQKERIILALKKTYTVAYLGDGINDVSAINAADIGISVDNAVDVAREAADVVLVEKDLMVLIDGIKEGRKTFANTLKYIFINTGSTFGNMFSVAAASLMLPFLPMLPKQILLTNFITDFPYLSIASDNVDENQLKKPGVWDLKFIRNYMVIFGIHSSIFDVITFLVLIHILKMKESGFQTGWFVESILTELLILFIIRTHQNFFKSKPGKYLVILSLIAIVITITLPYLPLAPLVGLIPLSGFAFIFMISIVILYIFTADLLKVWFFQSKR